MAKQLCFTYPSGVLGTLLKIWDGAFVKIVNGWKLFTIFAKYSTLDHRCLDVRQSSEYASVSKYANLYSRTSNYTTIHTFIDTLRQMPLYQCLYYCVKHRNFIELPGVEIYYMHSLCRVSDESSKTHEMTVLYAAYSRLWTVFSPRKYPVYPIHWHVTDNSQILAFHL